jgi:sphingolipid 4-desaturase/C4-monooxygenase
MNKPSHRTLVERANLLFLKQLVKSPRGRVHLLAQVADAESSGEGAIFERLAQIVDDAELQRLIARHAADEVRHGQRLNARITELGIPRPKLPDALNLAIALDVRLGVASGPLYTREDVMKMYLFLQVLEERTVWQFQLFVEAMADVDPTSAALFADILRDEERHVLSCQAITKRLAPSAAVLEQTLAHYRAIESQVFAENGNASLAFILNTKVLDESALVQGLWRVAGLFSRISLAANPHHSDMRFEQTDEVDIHRTRRKALLAKYPDITKLFGYDRRTIGVTIAVAIAHIGIAALLVWAHSGVMMMLASAYTVGAVLSHWLGQTIHETSHRLAARTRWANRALAWFANAPMVLPIAETFHRYHVEHHAHLGIVGHDADLPLPIEIDLVGKSRFAKFIWLTLYPAVYFARGARYARRVSAPEIANAVVIALINVALWKLLGPIGFAYLALSTFIGHGLHPVAAHFIHEHSLFSARQETSSYYGPLNRVTFNVGYHVEHHDFMNIPGWRLPEYRELVAPEYHALVSHTSWTRVLWEFIWRTDMGPASRLVRRPL